MNCDCKECLRRAWFWLDGDPGPVSSLLTYGIFLGAVAALCWWGWQ